MKFKCEHCETKVEVAKVCSQCGREHSEDWYYQNKNQSAIDEGITAPATIYVAFAFVWHLVSLRAYGLTEDAFKDFLSFHGVIGFCIFIATWALLHFSGATKSRTTDEIKNGEKQLQEVIEMIKNRSA